MSPRRVQMPAPGSDPKAEPGPLRAYLRYGEVRVIGPGSVLPAIMVVHATDYGQASDLSNLEVLRLQGAGTPYARTPNSRELVVDPWLDRPGVTTLVGRDVRGLDAEAVKGRVPGVS